MIAEHKCIAWVQQQFVNGNLAASVFVEEIDQPINNCFGVFRDAELNEFEFMASHELPLTI